MGKEAKYVFRLSDEEREQLKDLLGRGRVAKATRQRAQALLRADQGQNGPASVEEAIAGWSGAGCRPSIGCGNFTLAQSTLG